LYNEALQERLLQQRIVLLGGPLDGAASDDLISQMLLLSSMDPRSEVRLYINSAGGAAGEFLAVYDTMQALSAPVATICMSQAKGTAALLLAAGASGKRMAFRHASILLKSPVERVEGFGNVEAEVKEARRRTRSLIALAVRHTGGDEGKMETDLERGLFLTPQEAKERGVIDAVIEPGHPYFARFPLPPQPGGNGG
jgi:ATP-dependent Clp protease protease subunit